MAKQLSKTQYETVAQKLSAKGYTAETVYEALNKANFKIKLEGVEYSVYASRVIAIMHSYEEESPEENAIDLD